MLGFFIYLVYIVYHWVYCEPQSPNSDIYYLQIVDETQILS